MGTDANRVLRRQTSLFWSMMELIAKKTDGG
jgi:hypothetical protein